MGRPRREPPDQPRTFLLPDFDFSKCFISDDDADDDDVTGDGRLSTAPDFDADD